MAIEPTSEVGYWDRQRAAEYLGLTVDAIDYLCRTKQLEYHLLCNKRRFRRSDLDAYANQHRVEKLTEAR